MREPIYSAALKGINIFNIERRETRNSDTNAVISAYYTASVVLVESSGYGEGRIPLDALEAAINDARKRYENGEH